jgi:hypothetical protein
MEEGRMIWGVNNILLRRPVNYVFEIHDFYEKFNRVKGGHVHQQAIRLASCSRTPYIVRQQWDFIPHIKQVVYPWESVFNYFQTDMIGCSFDAMLALAIYCGWKDIQVYGFGANLASIYDYQVPTNNFWLGVCLGAKVNINFHSIGGLRHSGVMRTVDGKVYGLDQPQRKFPMIDVTLPACDCTKRSEAYCTDF